MSKITLNNVNPSNSNTTNATAINTNNGVIQTAFDNTLSRDGTAPNAMASSLDMDSNQILNLPVPATLQSPLRLADATSLTNTGTIVLLPAGGTTGQSLEKKSNTDYDVLWGNSVSSVGLSLPSDFTVTNSPVVTTGTLTGSWATTPTGTGAVVRATNPVLVTPNLGTPSAAVLTNATGLPVGSGVTGLATNMASFLASATSASLATTLTDETGSGSVVFSTTPTLVTPILGTPTSGVLTNCTGYSSNNLAGSAAGVNTFLGTPSSANLRAAMTDETGTGALVFAGGALGAATATTINGSVISPGHYSGEPSTGSAAAGEVGEFVFAQILGGSPVSLTSGVAANLTSISLTAGDWDISGGCQFTVGATTSTTFQGVWMSTTSATFSSALVDGYVAYQGGALVNYNAAYATGTKRLSLSATTTVYISVFSNFTVSTTTAYGQIRARRVR